MNKHQRRVMFSTGPEEWETPPELFNYLDNVFHFNLDVCATAKNAKCKNFITKEDDAFKTPWDSMCWMNPPYGRNVGKWVEHAYERSKAPTLTVVCLLPARTDTKWFHKYCTHGNIGLIEGRLRFVGAKSSAPFPSMIVVFGKDRDKLHSKWGMVLRVETLHFK